MGEASEGEAHSLPPGFRFHPTDEELLLHYLAHKISDSGFTGRAIADVDLNRCEPWDLPGTGSWVAPPLICLTFPACCSRGKIISLALPVCWFPRIITSVSVRIFHNIWVALLGFLDSSRISRVLQYKTMTSKWLDMKPSRRSCHGQGRRRWARRSGTSSACRTGSTPPVFGGTGRLRPGTGRPPARTRRYLAAPPCWSSSGWRRRSSSTRGGHPAGRRPTGSCTSTVYCPNLPPRIEMSVEASHFFSLLLRLM